MSMLCIVWGCDRAVWRHGARYCRNHRTEDEQPRPLRSEDFGRGGAAIEAAAAAEQIRAITARADAAERDLGEALALLRDGVAMHDNGFAGVDWRNKCFAWLARRAPKESP